MIHAVNLVSGYGNVEVLHGITVKAERGKITCIIGPNGAGKSTFLKVIARVLPAWNGRILVNGEDGTNLSPDQMLKKGIGLVPEGRRIFPRMTVRENLLMGAYLLNGRATVRDRLAAVFEEFPVLKEKQNQLAGTLSGGEQQMLAIARGLIPNPKAILLDEPSLGLAPKMVEKVYEKIMEINRNGTTIIIVEQNVRKALSVANWVYAFDLGMNRFDGTGEELLADNQLVKLYLGSAPRSQITPRSPEESQPRAATPSPHLSDLQPELPGKILAPR